MKLFSQRDAEEAVKTGIKEFRYNSEVRITPGAKDIFSENGVKVVFDSGAPAPANISPVGGASTTDAARLFNSPAAEKIKREICDIGHRIWLREYCDGNGGNISARIGPDAFICTPTGVSKGFLTPDMLCMVDGTGKQIAGSWARSSEITTHLAIYNSTPEAVSVCHAHPCHAGAFAIKGLQPPPRLIPELEVFVGTVAYTPYRTPGSKDLVDAITPLAPQHQSIIMGNHGVITWGKSVEDAYFKMEITDAYCRTVILAQSIPGGASIPCDKLPELLDMKKKLGLPDDRFGLKPAELCEVDPWSTMQDRPCACSTPANGHSHGGAPVKATNAELESLVQKVTEEIMQAIDKESK